MRFGRILIIAAVLSLSQTPSPAASFGGGQIIGGGVVDAATVPWTVALLQAGVSDSYQAQFCGGSLIAERWVLTAAHCVDGSAASSIEVAWGETDLSDYSAGDRRDIDLVAVNPGYNATNDTADIALLRLAAPAVGATTIGWNVNPAFPAFGQSLWTYGWGNTSTTGSSYPDSLHGVEIVDLAGPTGACGSYGSSYISDHMLCAGEVGGGQDACQGDSGGPIVAYTPAPVLVGDTSWGNGCAAAGFPGIWARVSSYADWIDQVIGSEPPALAIGDVTVVEGDTGTRAAKFTVTLNVKATTTITVPYSTSGGSAAAGVDFTNKSGTLSFAPGATSKTISIVTRADLDVEPNETFAVALGTPTGGAVLDDGTGAGTILDNDSGSGLRLAIGDVAVPEGDFGSVVKVQFTVSLNQAAGTTVVANYATSSGSAGTRDFTSKSGVLTFSATQTSKTVTVNVAREWIPEGDETFAVVLSGASGGGVSISRASGTATIRNDD